MARSTTNKSLDPKKVIKYDVLLVLFGIGFSIAEFYNQLLPIKFSLGLMLGVIILIAIGLLVSKRWIKVLIMLLIGVLIFGLVYSQFSLQRVLGNRGYKTETTSIIVVKESTIENIEQLEGKTIGYSPIITQEMLAETQSKLADITYTEKGDYSSDAEVAEELLNGGIDAMYLNEGMRATMNEMIEDFDEKTRIVSEFSVEVKQEETAKEVNTSSESFTVLISGIDTTGPVSSVSRSDVNILMTVNPNTHEILTVSIPRDSFIPISCFGGAKDKLTHSGIKGSECTVKSLENYLGININYYARVNFTSVINLLNIVGPIDVYSHYTFIGYEGSSFVQGMNTLNAAQALEFSRTRSTVPGGDFTRGIHQQEVIKGTFNKLLRSINPVNIEPIIAQVNRSVDTNMSTSAVAGLMQKQINENPAWNFETYAIDGTTGWSTTALYPYQQLSIVHPNTAKVQEASNLINSMK